jgi:hypothetical protein
MKLQDFYNQKISKWRCTRCTHMIDGPQNEYGLCKKCRAKKNRKEAEEIRIAKNIEKKKNKKLPWKCPQCLKVRTGDKHVIEEKYIGGVCRKCWKSILQNDKKNKESMLVKGLKQEIERGRYLSY